MNVPNLNKEIWKSKRFISAVATVIALVIVSLVPEFEDMQNELVETLTLLGGLLIAGYTFTDFAAILVVMQRIAKLTPTKVDDEFLAALGGK